MFLSHRHPDIRQVSQDILEYKETDSETTNTVDKKIITSNLNLLQFISCTLGLISLNQ